MRVRVCRCCAPVSVSVSVKLVLEGESQERKCSRAHAAWSRVGDHAEAWCAHTASAHECDIPAQHAMCQAHRTAQYSTTMPFACGYRSMIQINGLYYAPMPKPRCSLLVVVYIVAAHPSPIPIQKGLAPSSIPKPNQTKKACLSSRSCIHPTPIHLASSSSGAPPQLVLSCIRSSVSCAPRAQSSYGHVSYGSGSATVHSTHATPIRMT